MILDSDSMTWIPPQAFWDGSRCGQFSSLFTGAAGWAPHGLVALRRGALADWAQMSVGLMRPHAVYWTSHGDWDVVLELGGRVQPLANLMAEKEESMKGSWDAVPGARGIRGAQQMQMCAAGHAFPWCSSLPPVSSGVMSLFSRLFAPAETSLLPWSSHLPKSSSGSPRGKWQFKELERTD